ncbi:MAG TPA: hypothetical protein PLQ97_07045 [Myxococcota bacterium]|nr:hypothetical protein [Myxococcota bacterium]HQK51959.1 hypothetical protein [Myxococcota bacterium]
MGRGDRAFWGVFGLLVVACAVPVFAVDRVPGADLPSHLAILRHLADALDHPEAFSQAMEVRPWQPYWGFYGPTLLLAQAVPLDLAARLVIFGALVCLPVAVFLVARREGADPRVALGAFPLLFGFNYYWGFEPFYVSACLAVMGLLPVLRFAREGGRCSLIWVHLASGAIFVAHATAWALWAAWSLWVLVTEAGHRRRVLGGATAMVVPLGLFLIWKASAGLEGITQAPATHSLLYKASRWAHHAFPALSPTWEAVLTLGWSGLVGLAIPEAPHLVPSPDRRRRVVRWGGLAIGMFLAYWVLPQDVAELSFVYPRFLVFAGVFLLLALAGRIRFHRAFLVGATALGLVAVSLAAVASARFSERSAGAWECLARSRPGSILMPFSFERDDPDLRYPLFLHAGAWHAYRNRGRVFGDWIEALPTSMVRWKDPRGLGTPPPVFLWSPRPLEDPAMAAPVEYFLIHGPRQVRPPGGDPVVLDRLLLAGIPVLPEPVCESGRWRLYRRAPPLETEDR